MQEFYYLGSPPVWNMRNDNIYWSSDSTLPLVNYLLTCYCITYEI